MSFSYDIAQLASNPIYQVRYRLGDTVETMATFQDEEIQFSLTNNSNNILRTCIECVTALLPRLALRRDFKIGPYTETLSSNSYDYWVAMLAELKAQLTSAAAPVMLPPMTPPLFYYGMMGVDDYDPTDPSGYI